MVTVDGAPRGKTPVVVANLRSGKHRVRVALRGYAPVEREVEVRPDESTRHTLDLVPLREVTAVSRYAQRVDEAPSSVSIIDAREIRAFTQQEEQQYYDEEAKQFLADRYIMGTCPTCGACSAATSMH